MVTNKRKIVKPDGKLVDAPKREEPTIQIDEVGTRIAISEPQAQTLPRTYTHSVSKDGTLRLQIDNGKTMIQRSAFGGLRMESDKRWVTLGNYVSLTEALKAFEFMTRDRGYVRAEAQA